MRSLSAVNFSLNSASCCGLTGRSVARDRGLANAQLGRKRGLQAHGLRVSPHCAGLSRAVNVCRLLSRAAPSGPASVRTRGVPSLWKKALLVVLALAAVLAMPWGARLWRAQRLLRALAAAPTAVTDEIHSEELVIPRHDRPIRARLYRRADGTRGPGLVVAHGVHHQG